MTLKEQYKRETGVGRITSNIEYANWIEKKLNERNEDIKAVCLALIRASGWYGEPTCVCGADELKNDVVHNNNCPVLKAERLLKEIDRK